MQGIHRSIAKYIMEKCKDRILPNELYATATIMAISRYPLRVISLRLDELIKEKISEYYNENNIQEDRVDSEDVFAEMLKMK